MAEGIRWLRDWTTEVQPKWLNANEEAIERWLSWMIKFQLGRKRILDTQYAAPLHAHGIRRLLTNNSDDFKVFGAFEIVTF